MTEASVIDSWKQHVLQCGLCSNAKSQTDLCPIGRNFWNAPQAVAEPVQAVPVQAPVQQPPPQQAIDVRMAAHIASHVAARVVARSSSGSAIAVPMEKTSKAVTFATAPNVILQMPERDIEVYAEMQALIRDLMRVANMVSHAMSAEEETRKFVRQTPSIEHANQAEVALIVAHTRAQFGVGTDEQLYYDFSNMAARVLRMGDRLGNFMRVDDETRRISRAARTLAVSMQEVLELSSVDVFSKGQETRQALRGMRLFAIDLQGEIERRVGTP